MYKQFDFANATHAARSACVEAIKDVISIAANKDAFCAGDFVRNVLVFDDVMETRPFKTVDLYFPDCSKACKTIQTLSYDLYPTDIDNEFQLIKFDLILARIVFHPRDSYTIKFDIDRLAYKGGFVRVYTQGVYDPIGDSQLVELVGHIKKKEVDLISLYIVKCQETNDYSAVLELANEDYCLCFPNGSRLVKGTGSTALSNTEIVTLFNQFANNIKPKKDKKDKIARKKRIAELLKELAELTALDD